ncbi:MAG: hypothetical protein CMF50_05680 [Legionellales bacterium]|nr:hypothetical protein [Legionellales bacterium]|tara:strand:+ start:12649 stop:13608 length:960 start_codon:yes stop_codon:yes gene_type:complete
MNEKNSSKLLIGVSQCLLGEKVRFNGDHKRDRYICGMLSDYADYRPVCPEVAIGMGVPRPPIHQEGNPEDPTVVGVQDKSINVTKPLKQFSKQYVKDLDELSGFILKSKSPTCGMERIKVYQHTGQALRNGIGVFARELIAAYPYLPIEEEGRLCDPVLRENFITRIFAYYRWQQLMLTKPSKKDLVEFHTRHKLLLRSHNEAGYQRLGTLMADLKDISLTELKQQYLAEFMSTLKTRANAKKHANVLYHMLGYLKKHLDQQDKEEMVNLIESYRKGKVPLVVPITLFKHHFRRFPNPYIEQQYYLTPHPDELMLRNHV